MTPKPPIPIAIVEGLKSGLKKGFEFQNFDKLQKLRLGTPIWGQGVKKTKIIFNLD